MVKILVTGGCGFVGSELVKKLSKQKGTRVTVFDRKIKNPIYGVKYLKGDITHSDDVRRAFWGQDCVYHLAAIIEEDCPKKLLFDINVGGTITVLEACRKEKTKKLIYVSTAGVMEETKEKANEKTLYGPKTNYERSKTFAEKTVLEYYKRFKLPVVIIRPALIYGPNDYWNLILKKAKKLFPVLGSGKNKLHMLYIKNFLPALISARTRGKEGEIYVIADEKVQTYEEMYRIIRKHLKIEKEPIHVPVWSAKLLALLYRIFGKKSIVSREHIDRLIKNRFYNISKAKRHLDYKPRYDFNKGIKETIKYFRKVGTL